MTTRQFGEEREIGRQGTLQRRRAVAALGGGDLSAQRAGAGVQLADRAACRRVGPRRGFWLMAAALALSLPVAFRRSLEEDSMRPEKRLFGYSVFYLFALFAALVADRVLAQNGVIG
mgnify:CR=1 FL=1